MPFSNPIAGGQGSLVRPAIKSPDYTPGVTGWSINRDGTAEFQDITVGDGTITGSIIYLGDPVTIELNGPDGVIYLYDAGNQVGRLEGDGLTFIPVPGEVVLVDIFGMYIYSDDSQGGSGSEIDIYINSADVCVIEMGPEVLPGQPFLNRSQIGTVAYQDGAIYSGALLFRSPYFNTLDAAEIYMVSEESDGVDQPVIDLRTIDGATRIMSGDFQILDAGATTPASTPRGARALTASTSAFSSFGTVATTVIAVGSFVFRAGRAYRISYGGGWGSVTGSPTRINTNIRKTNAAGAVWIDFGWQTMLAGAPIFGGQGTGYVRRNASTDLSAGFVLTALCDTGTAQHFANSTLRRWLLIEDCGSSADFATVAFDVT